MSDSKYDEYLSRSREMTHSYVIETSNAICLELKHRQPNIRNVVFYDAMEHLPVICEQTKARRLDVVKNPLGTMSLWQSNYQSELEKWSEGIFRFDNIGKEPIYAGNLIYLNNDYSTLSTCKISVIFAESEDDVGKFIAAYNDAIRAHNRKNLPCVLDSRGRRMVGFRPMSWSEIFLAGTMATDIQNEVKNFFASKKTYDEYGLHWRRGLLLTGKPGDGKTSICRAIATEVDCPVIYVTLNTNDAFALLEEVESTIGENSPCVVIFEDADSIGGDAMLRSRLLNMLDGMCSKDGVLSIATTNSPEKLDAALTGRPSRFDSLYVIADPTTREIEKILKKHLKIKSNVSDADFKKVTMMLHGFSAAAAQETAVSALLDCMNSNKKVTGKELIAAARKVKAHMLASKDGRMDDSKRGEGFSDALADTMSASRLLRRRLKI